MTADSQREQPAVRGRHPGWSWGLSVLVATALLLGGIAPWTWTAPTPPPQPSVPPETSMPRGDLPGWRQVIADDFSAASLGPAWRKYSGAPGRTSSPDVWSPSRVGVEGGRLVLRGRREGGRWTTGGVCACSEPQTYGKWEVRMRVDPNAELKYAALLWPTGGWPPEIDFAEDGGGRRGYTLGSLHHGSDNTTVQRKTSTDLTTWQVLGVEWSPRTIRYTLNGRTWAAVRSEHVPDEPMWFGIQLQTGGCAAEGSRCRGRDRSSPTAALEVDWFVAYARE